MKFNLVLPCLVVNTNQTGIHFVPNVGERTWENKGSKHIQVLGMEDKRQIILVVSSIANGNLLPRQVVFIGITHRCLFSSNEGKQKCINSSWNFTFSENHWSTVETMKDFVRKVLLA